MNALTPGKPKPGSRPGRQGGGESPPAAGETGVRLTMEVDDVPLDQLPDGGMDPAQFARRDGTDQARGREAGRARAHAEEAHMDGHAPPGTVPDDDPDAPGATGRSRVSEPLQQSAARRDRALAGDERPRAGGPGEGRPVVGDPSAAAARADRGRDRVRADAVADEPVEPDDRAMHGHAHGHAASAAGRGQRLDAMPGEAVPEPWDDDGWAHAEPAMARPDPRNGGPDRTMAGGGGMGASPASGGRAPARVPGRLAGISVIISVELGRQKVALGALMASEPGQLFTLDRLTSEPVDVLVNGQLFARGEVVMIGDQFGVRLTELIEPEG